MRAARWQKELAKPCGGALGAAPVLRGFLIKPYAGMM